jgi:hypothetical protein
MSALNTSVDVSGRGEFFDLLEPLHEARVPFVPPTPTWYWPARRLRKLPRNGRIASSAGRGDCPRESANRRRPGACPGTRQRKSPHFRAGLDLLTVEAVDGEPVSGANSLHQGIYQGIFRACARLCARKLLTRRGLRGVRKPVCAADQGIIVDRNREYIRPSRENLRAAAVADQSVAANLLFGSQPSIL